MDVTLPHTGTVAARGPETPLAAAADLHPAVAETHTAVVVFVGDRAYKAKKPVDMGFLDFSSASARQRACIREVELNRRFSPDVYEGVGEFRGPGGLQPEPVVVMRRMPGSRRLSHLVAVGAPVTEHVRQVARLLATCHARSSRSADISRDGTRDALLSRWEAGIAQVRELGEGVAPMPSLEETEERVRRYLAGREDLFDRRIRQSRVVDGHGDLLAEDIFCLDDGPRLLDCLEFDDTLRHVDGLDDAAFLAMDLERLGAPDTAAYFLSCYSEYAGDPAPTSLWHHYVAYRAFVREKVSVLRARQGAPEARAEAARLAGITVGHLRTSAVRMILVGGLPGSGKSTLAAALADRLGFTLLSSDRVRKELSGKPPEAPAGAEYGGGIYSPSWTRRTYGELVARATALLSAGESVVVDATWTSRELRDRAADAARLCSADLVPLVCSVPQAVADRRLTVRRPGPSDADAAVAQAMARAADPWPEAVQVDTGGVLATAVGQALAAIHPEGAGQRPPFRRPYMTPG